MSLGRFEEMPRFPPTLDRRTHVRHWTARDESNTLAALGELSPVANYQVVDLRELNIAPYKYEGVYPEGQAWKVTFAAAAIVKVTNRASRVPLFQS